MRRGSKAAASANASGTNAASTKAEFESPGDAEVILDC